MNPVITPIKQYWLVEDSTGSYVFNTEYAAKIYAYLRIIKNIPINGFFILTKDSMYLENERHNVYEASPDWRDLFCDTYNNFI